MPWYETSADWDYHSGYTTYAMALTSKAIRVKSINTYREALGAIWERSGYDRGYISNPFAGDGEARLGLMRTQQLLDQAGHVNLPYAIIHVAGSKGKGSTCTMVDAILRAANLRTGRYLSPHLHSFRERFVVNDGLVSEEAFIKLTHQFVSLAEQIEDTNPELGQITAFELTTAMALAFFAQQSCDVAVVEVGLGGTLDATNIISPCVSVITTLDYEHTAILGSTMAEIAANKAGIIKHSRPVLTVPQPNGGLDIISQRATESDAPLLIAHRDWQVEGDHTNFTFSSESHNFSGLECALVGSHQVENAGLAIATVLALKACNLPFQAEERAIRKGLASAQLPGRFEQVALPTRQTLVIDAAHTPASAAALAAAVQQRFAGASIAIVIGMLADKNIGAFLSPLLPIATLWIAAAPVNPRSMSANEIRDAIAVGGHRVEMAASVEDGLGRAKRSCCDLIVVTGSFATAAEARIASGLAEVIDPPMQL